MIYSDPSNGMPVLPRGDLGSNYFTTLNDIYASGLAAKLRPNAIAVWEAIKSHSNFATGRSHPGIRRLSEICGISKDSVQKAITHLEKVHMLRVERTPKRNFYFPREMVFVWDNRRVVAAVSVQYVPCKIHIWLAAIKGKGEEATAREAWKHAELVSLSLLQQEKPKPDKEKKERLDTEPEQELSAKQKTLMYLKAYTDDVRAKRAAQRA